MKKWLLNNIGWKILAVILSIILWLVVVNFNDPIITETFNGIPVTIKNELALDSQGKVFEVLDNTDIVNVTIRAARSIIDEISKEDIYATADLNEVSYVDTIEIEAYTNKNNHLIKEISTNIDSVKLNIEDGRSKQLVIIPNIIGQPEEGYIQGDTDMEQNIVRVSGPDSLVSELARAEVEVNIDGMVSNINTNATLKLYDEKGELVENENISQNINSINVGVEILKTKEVPITIEVQGKPLEGFVSVEENIITPETIIVAGSEKKINSISSIKIADKSIDITGAYETVVEQVNIKKYLADGIVLTNNFDGIIEIIVPIEEVVTEVFEIEKNQIKTINNIEGYNSKIIVESPILVTADSTRKLLGEVDDKNILGTIDLAKLTDGSNIIEGRYVVKPEWNLGTDIEVNEMDEIQIVITKN